MEKAVLKTLIYAEIFDYPLTIREIHKWLIGKKASLRNIEKVLKKLNKESRIKNYGGYYFLSDRNSPVRKRLKKRAQSVSYLRKAKLAAYLLKIIPWIKLIGISGGLAMENASSKDDIDLFLITCKRRLWISRLLVLIVLSLIGQRRKARDSKREASGKICCNLLLEEDNLEQQKKNLYMAHEVLQMKVLWQRNGIYQKYLEDNSWVFKYLPNWTTALSSPRRLASRSGRGSNKQFPPQVFNWIPASAGMTIENLAKKFQLWYMSKPKGMERIEDGALFFHPKDSLLSTQENFKLGLDKYLKSL